MHFGSAEASHFDRIFRRWVERTCKEWKYQLPSESYYADIYDRLPLGLRITIATGFKKGIIKDVGKSKTGSAAFRPIDVPEIKGPYSWFERDRLNRVPRPAWEYYIQVSEYTRLWNVFHGKNFKLYFEDDLMDIALKRGNDLIVCCEAKEKSKQAQALISGIRKWENASSLPKEDRGNDPLRKAKYIVKKTPSYFYVISIGRRFEYRISYSNNLQFQLNEDMIPFL